MNRRQILGATLVGLLAVGVFFTTGAARAADVCPEEGKVESQVDGDLDNIVLDAGTVVCIKAGQDLVTVTADGESTLAELIDNGHNVSHYTVIDETTTTTIEEETSTTQSDEEPTTTTIADTTTTTEESTTTTVEDTTTTVDDTTTTTVEDTTTTSVEETTTTTGAESTTTTAGDTTTTVADSTTTTEDTTTTTAPTVTTLPFTGLGNHAGFLVLLASTLLGLGLMVVSAVRRRA